MENRLITSSDGMTWMDVTDKAKEVFNAGLFRLYEFYENGETTVRIPIESHEHLNMVLNADRSVVIKVGQGRPIQSEETITKESWNLADKISHNGFIYVRYTDLRFCR